MFGTIFTSAFSIIFGASMAFTSPLVRSSPTSSPIASPVASLPFAKIEADTRPAEPRLMTVTAYSSSPDETDDTPFITASNTRVRDGIVATNTLPFGTHIRIPSMFGAKEFIVEDRMHERYQDYIDIWFPSKQRALRFGIAHNVLVEVLGEPSTNSQR